MARKKKRDRGLKSIGQQLKEETMQGIWTIVFFALSVFLLLSAVDFAGVVGKFTYRSLSYLLGIGYFLLPALSLLLAASFLTSLEKRLSAAKILGAVIFFLAGLGLIAILLNERGGVVGIIVSTPLLGLFEVYAAVLILGTLLLVSLLVILDTAISFPSLGFLWRLFKKGAPASPDPRISGDIEEDETGTPTGFSGEETGSEPKVSGEGSPAKSTAERHEPVGEPAFSPRLLFARSHGAYTPPPLSLLEKDRGKPDVGDIKANANIIKRTMQNFGIDVEVDEISIGPTVTRYALKPAEGVRLSKIVALQNNLELALAAHPVRIEAPIPGRSLVGIEVPNMKKSTVGLATLLSSDAFQKSEKPLLIVLGKDIAGASHFADLGRMPHLLIAGATGAGKSVTIHAIITSLLFRNAPEFLRFILIDPKRVELTLYNNIPHLLTPVVTDPKKTILALKWAAKEMDRRYDILEAEKVRDIESYHKNVYAPALSKNKEGKDLPEPLPYLVIVIDELADIMTAYPRELEAAVVRLAQMSRAVGIHLILSTQRPSVNVITGLIKANIPARVALQVSSQIDSRTILDSGGAEKLLGAGDLLFLSGEMSKPRRLQAPFISETEVKKVTSFLIEHNESIAPSEEESSLTFSSNGERNGLVLPTLEGEGLDDDELYEEARLVVVQANKASTSYLQRKLRVGYARAARLMDMLEERGVIGPSDGAKPREILFSSSESGGEAKEDTGV